jgi:hypothetical protein
LIDTREIVRKEILLKLRLHEILHPAIRNITCFFL